MAEKDLLKILNENEMGSIFLLKGKRVNQLKDVELREYIRNFTSSEDWVFNHIGLLIAAIFSERKSTFAWSGSTHNDLVHASSAYGLSKIDGSKYARVRHQVIKLGIIEPKIDPIASDDPKQRRAGIYSVKHPQLIEIFTRMFGEERMKSVEAVVIERRNLRNSGLPVDTDKDTNEINHGPDPKPTDDELKIKAFENTYKIHRDIGNPSVAFVGSSLQSPNSSFQAPDSEVQIPSSDIQTSNSNLKSPAVETAKIQTLDREEVENFSFRTRGSYEDGQQIKKIILKFDGDNGHSILDLLEKKLLSIDSLLSYAYMSRVCKEALSSLYAVYRLDTEQELLEDGHPAPNFHMAIMRIFKESVPRRTDFKFFNESFLLSLAEGDRRQVLDFGQDVLDGWLAGHDFRDGINMAADRKANRTGIPAYERAVKHLAGFHSWFYHSDYESNLSSLRE